MIGGETDKGGMLVVMCLETCRCFSNQSCWSNDTLFFLVDDLRKIGNFKMGKGGVEIK